MNEILSPPRSPNRGGIRPALLCSITVHAIAMAAVLWLTYVASRDPLRVEVAPIERPDIVWIASPGLAGGGGGRSVPAPRPAEPPPAPQARTPQPAEATESLTEPESREPLNAIPAQAVTSLVMAGAADAPIPTPGTGAGNGVGDGDGAGIGPGRDRGFGDGAYRAGNGVTSPIPVVRGTPHYTVEAMRARAQGVITVECVVEPQGECGDVRVVRSFAPPFGLDGEALAAARRWRFRPGTRDGDPVRVLVQLEIEFNIR